MNDSRTTPSRAILELVDITKRFGSVVANDRVSFDLRPGEIHALVGENGAGKTTLMRVLFGMYRPDEGQLRLNGQPVSFKKPLDSIRHGLGMVHQHFMLVPSFTVAENLTLGTEPRKGLLYDAAAAAQAVQDLMRPLGLDIDPATVTGTLNIATQQKLEIVKVLYRGARVIILDEPTAVLTPQETDELFDLLQRLRSEGVSVIFISHKLREVFAIAARITVMRAGCTVTTVDAHATDAAGIAASMTGRSDVNLGRVERGPTSETMTLSVTDLRTDRQPHDAALDDVSFCVRAGEIVGIAGVEGNGQAALAEALIGTIPANGGTVELSGQVLSGTRVTQRRTSGLAYVPEDRHLEGLPINGTVIEGLAALRLRDRRRLRVLDVAFPASMRDWAKTVIDRYSIRTSGPEARCATLSGGNQQKVVIAREIECEPRCLILAQPTRGVDLGAIEFIYEKIAGATASGCAIVLISADLDELLRLSDRVLVMYRGRIVAEERVADTTRERLGLHMAGATEGETVS